MFNSLRILILSQSKSIIHQQSRNAGRWVSRRPVKVIPSEEYNEETDSQIIEPSKTKWSENYSKIKLNRNVKPLTISKRKPPKTAVDMLETIIDQEGHFIYTKMKDSDTRIVSILTEIKSSKVRSTRNLILLEGKRLIKEALDAKCKLEYILFSRLDDVEFLRSSLPRIGAKLYKMPYKEIQMWSNLSTSPGLMAIFQIPNLESFIPPKDAIPLTIICDNIREPDNLGAILRTSSGVGCEKILLTKGCVDVWDSKVLRSACGAHFNLKIETKLELESASEKLPSNCNIYIADNNTISNATDDDCDEEGLSRLVQSVPLIPYYALDFDPNAQNVLIVGGETEGISQKSYELVSKLNGLRLNIPLGNKIKCLNVGTALGIIVFEMKRQCMTK